MALIRIPLPLSFIPLPHGQTGARQICLAKPRLLRQGSSLWAAEAGRDWGTVWSLQVRTRSRNPGKPQPSSGADTEQPEAASPLVPGGVAGRTSMGDRRPPEHTHGRDSLSTGRRAGPHMPEFPSCPRSKEKAEGSVLLPATPSRRSGWRSRVSAPGQPPHPCPAPAGRRAPGTNPGPQRCPAPHTRGSVCLQPLGTQTQPPERVKLPW